MYVKQEVPGKGLGLVATQDIPKGTRILCEEAMMIVPNDLPPEKNQQLMEKQFHDSSELQQKEFLSLHNVHRFNTSPVDYRGIFATNALPMNKISDTSGPLHRVDDAGIFLEACRINHSCDDNAVTNWNENTNRHTVTACRDICKDEEITIYYLGTRNSRKVRHEQLDRDFNFECLCRLCSLPPPQRKESDRQLRQISHLFSFVYGRGYDIKTVNPLRDLHQAELIIRLYKEHGNSADPMGNTYLHAAHIVLHCGDLARGREFAKRAVSDWTTLFGSDCVQIKMWGYLQDDPLRFVNYGVLSNAWKTAINEIPNGLDTEEFELWLWRKERADYQERIADFRDSDIFPTIYGLPLPENTRYHEDNGNGLYRAMKHWCFLGEITDLEKFGESEMAVRDTGGTVIKLTFETEEEGKEIEASLLRKKNTVALLNANRNKLPSEGGDNQLSICHDDELMLKVWFHLS